MLEAFLLPMMFHLPRLRSYAYSAGTAVAAAAFSVT